MSNEKLLEILEHDPYILEAKRLGLHNSWVEAWSYAKGGMAFYDCGFRDMNCLWYLIAFVQTKHPKYIDTLLYKILPTLSPQHQLDLHLHLYHSKLHQIDMASLTAEQLRNVKDIYCVGSGNTVVDIMHCNAMSIKSTYVFTDEAVGIICDAIPAFFGMKGRFHALKDYRVLGYNFVLHPLTPKSKPFPICYCKQQEDAIIIKIGILFENPEIAIEAFCRAYEVSEHGDAKNKLWLDITEQVYKLCDADIKQKYSEKAKQRVAEKASVSHTSASPIARPGI